MNICKYECVSLFGCFKGFSRVRNINFPIGFNTSNVIDMKKMFYKCKSLNTIELSDFNQAMLQIWVVYLVNVQALLHLIYPNLIRAVLLIWVVCFMDVVVWVQLIYLHLI